MLNNLCHLRSAARKFVGLLNSWRPGANNEPHQCYPTDPPPNELIHAWFPALVLSTSLPNPLWAIYIYLSAAALKYWLQPFWPLLEVHGTAQKDNLLKGGGGSVLIGTAMHISVGRPVCFFHCVDPEVSFCSFSAYLVTSSKMGHRLRKTAATVNSAPTLEV